MSRDWGICECGCKVRPDHCKKDRKQLCGKCYLKKKKILREKKGLE